MAQLGQTIQKPFVEPENSTIQLNQEIKPKRAKLWWGIIIILFVIAIGLGIYYWY